MKKIMISSPRCGSTVGQHTFEKWHEFHGDKGIRCKDLFNGWHEFFFAGKHGIHKPLDWKVDFIESIHPTFHYKLHAWHLFELYDNGILYDWFKEYYKGIDVVVLKRKDTWRAYLSLLVHYTIGRDHCWHKYKEKDEEDFEIVCSVTDFKYNPDIETSFMYQQQCLNMMEGDVIYLEDQDWEGSMKWDIDYEKLFDSEELKLLRRNFLEVSNKFRDKPRNYWRRKQTPSNTR